MQRVNARLNFGLQKSDFGWRVSATVSITVPAMGAFGQANHLHVSLYDARLLHEELGKALAKADAAYREAEQGVAIEKVNVNEL